MPYEHLSHWKIHDSLTVTQIAYLMYGADPAEHPPTFPNEKAIRHHTAFLGAIVEAIKSETLAAEIHWVIPEGYKGRLEYDEKGEAVCMGGKPDFLHSYVMVTDLREWLQSKGLTNNFFFDGKERENGAKAAYLQTDHPHYAHKLAAAVAVWEVLNSNPDLMRIDTPKIAAEKWLEANAERLDLLYNGKPSGKAIADIARIINWKKGGSNPTPSREEGPE